MPADYIKLPEDPKYPHGTRVRDIVSLEVVGRKNDSPTKTTWVYLVKMDCCEVPWELTQRYLRAYEIGTKNLTCRECGWVRKKQSKSSDRKVLSSKEIINAHWIDPDKPGFQSAMNIMQAELIRSKLPNMDKTTRMRAIKTLGALP